MVEKAPLSSLGGGRNGRLEIGRARHVYMRKEEGNKPLLTRVKQSKPKSPVKKKKKRGPDSTADVKKTNSMDEVLGIEPLAFSDEEADTVELMNVEKEIVDSLALDARDSIKRDAIRMDFAHFMEAKQFREAQTMSANAVSRGKEVLPPILRFGNIIRNLDSKFVGSPSKQRVKITKEDMQEEVDFWTPSIVCYVLGANPPMSILDGFVRRVWKDKINKVGMISHGIFLVLFKSIDDRNQVLSRVYIFFNKRLSKSGLKMRMMRTLLFVSYEWKPTTCAHCKGIDHETKDCRNKEGKQKAEWVIKKPNKVAVQESDQAVDEDGFKPAKKIWIEKPKDQTKVATITVTNTYASLQEEELVEAELMQTHQQQRNDQQEAINIGDTGAGGVPPLPNE
uniref:DUF4283 domain-containing protein n=1 Tax=Cannabis sativa TaxID=3483 RepID=A0A803QPT3_CANSA